MACCSLARSEGVVDSVIGIGKILQATSGSHLILELIPHSGREPFPLEDPTKPCNPPPLRHFLWAVKEALEADREFGLHLMRGQPASVWCLDFLKIEGDRLILDGWALAPGRVQAGLHRQTA